jgi:nucleotide-binding universal stress UspA family protein
MNKMSILLALSGSEQAYEAAQLAWNLADQVDATVTAQHVVDTQSAWALLGNDKPGLIGSGLYIAAYETLCGSLKDLATKLAEKYEHMDGANKTKSTCFVDEGDPVHEICSRAKEHDLVIVGHAPTVAKHTSCRTFSKASVAEGLANYCNKPLLVVQRKPEPWKSLKILVSIEHLNIEYILSCLCNAHRLNLKPQLVCLATGVHEEKPQDMIRNLRYAHKELADVEIDVALFGDFAAQHNSSLWSHQTIRVELDAYADSLVVVPTREIGGKRITIFGSSPEMFIEFLTLPTILFFPEEVPAAKISEPAKAVSASMR